MNAITPINNNITVPRTQWKKLWNWCRKRSNIDNGRVMVRIYNSSDYGVKADLAYARMGRAVPTVTLMRRFDHIANTNVVSGSRITWSYVY